MSHRRQVSGVAKVIDWVELQGAPENSVDLEREDRLALLSGG
jgi:hypothetical protein